MSQLPQCEAMTLADAAKKLSMTYETLRRKASKGTIPAFKVGGVGQWRIFEDDLLRCVRGQYVHTERSTPNPESVIS